GRVSLAGWAIRARMPSRARTAFRISAVSDAPGVSHRRRVIPMMGEWPHDQPDSPTSIGASRWRRRVTVEGSMTQGESQGETGPVGAGQARDLYAPTIRDLPVMDG